MLKNELLTIDLFFLAELAALFSVHLSSSNVEGER